MICRMRIISVRDCVECCMMMSLTVDCWTCCVLERGRYISCARVLRRWGPDVTARSRRVVWCAA